MGVELIDPRSHILHPQKLTWNLEMMVSNRNLLFQGSIFRFHVCFGGCIYYESYTFVRLLEEPLTGKRFKNSDFE